MLALRYDPDYADDLHEWTPVEVVPNDPPYSDCFDVVLPPGADERYVWSVFHGRLGKGVEVSFL